MVESWWSSFIEEDSLDFNRVKKWRYWNWNWKSGLKRLLRIMKSQKYMDRFVEDRELLFWYIYKKKNGGHVQSRGDILRQISRVLRLKQGDKNIIAFRKWPMPIKDKSHWQGSTGRDNLGDTREIKNEIVICMRNYTRK